MKISVSISNLRIRQDHSTSSKVLGYVTPGLYDVLETYQGVDYIWYKINQGWIAAVDGVSEASSIVPAGRDESKNQIYVGVSSLRIREKPTTASNATGFCEKDKYYDVLGIEKTTYYDWYKIGDNAWCAGVEGVVYYSIDAWKEPQPVDADTEKDQIYVGNVSLNIRKNHSLTSEKMGICQKYSNYNVYKVVESSTYTWYEIGQDAWIAKADPEIVYYPKGSSRIGPVLAKQLESLSSAIELAQRSIKNNANTLFYESLLVKAQEITQFINSNFDPFEYDLVDDKAYEEIDLLYTADVHGAWVGYDTDGNYLTPIFSYNDIGNYRDKLAKNNIKALLVDCGDWSRPCRAYNDYLNTGIMQPAEQMKKQKYFAATYGNHEWRWSQYGEASTKSILDKLNCMTACNLFDKNGKLIYPAYRTAKIGNKRIAVIGIGYPSANGTGSYSDGVWEFEDFKFYDDQKLFKTVQGYIDLFKQNKFDYIVAICHMCKSNYESDNRYKARTDSLIENTNGLSAVIQGHYNFATNAEILTDKGGNKVLLAHEAGANMNSFGRLKFSGKNVTSYLLDEKSDLNVI